MSDDVQSARHILRHTLATLAYRAARSRDRRLV